MSIANTLEKVFIYFGKDANPALIATGIAGAKAIFRPTFTMMDKDQDPKAKRYAALREGLTEVLAMGIYYASGKLTTAAAKALTKPKEMTKETFKTIIEGGKNLPKNITEDAARGIKNNFFKVNSTLSMLGVFASALVIIPEACSLVIRPLMKELNKKEQKKLDINTAAPIKPNTWQPSFQDNNSNKIFNTFPDRFSSGMRVGGV